MSSTKKENQGAAIPGSAILGISAYYHDSAAALLVDGKLVAAAEEERFTRIKHDAGFPEHAVRFCLDHAALTLDELDCIVFYDKPLLKFSRLVKTFLDWAPKSMDAYMTAMPLWLGGKIAMRKNLRQCLAAMYPGQDAASLKMLFSEHHQAHAASAFYPSPFADAAVLCLDGVGEWATTSAWLGRGNQLDPLWQIDFPHSLDLLYSAFTYYCGFKVNSGEYKLMGLAPYGEPKYVQPILDHLIDIKRDGSFRLNMDYFDYAAGFKMVNSRFEQLFGAATRRPESALTQREMDIASSIQHVTEKVVLKLANALHQEHGVKQLCMAGGVALNCVANGRLSRESPFERIWVQPASGDSGGAVGAAYAAYHDYYGNERAVEADDGMSGCYLGPASQDVEVQNYLDGLSAPYQRYSDEDLFERVAAILDEKNVVGWYQGRMEFGPRALGHRSILGDPRDCDMQTVMNLKIKKRESFRPFAPVVKEEKLSEWFAGEGQSPYMLFVMPVNETKRTAAEDQAQTGLDRLKLQRSQIPAVTHVDYSARVQTVSATRSPRFYALLDAFEERTGCPVLINTSFNVRGEPIVCTPEDAYRCFMTTDMDYLVINNFVLAKKDQVDVKVDFSEQAFPLD